MMGKGDSLSRSANFSEKSAVEAEPIGCHKVWDFGAKNMLSAENSWGKEESISGEEEKNIDMKYALLLTRCSYGPKYNGAGVHPHIARYADDRDS